MELVISTFGTSLNRDNEGFVITTTEGRQRIPAEGITSIQISRGAQISSDAVMLAMEREIEVLFMDKNGNVTGRIWSPKYGSVSTIRKGQLNFSFSPDAIQWIKEIICQKIENQQALLLTFETADLTVQAHVQKSIRRLEDYRTKISTINGEVISDIASTLRGWEGLSSKIYFETLNLFLPEQYRFEKRTQHPATDVTNHFSITDMVFYTGRWKAHSSKRESTPISGFYTATTTTVPFWFTMLSNSTAFGWTMLYIRFSLKM